jgi:hypothetical protein
MAKPKIGEMLLHDWIQPPLLAGKYRLQIDTEVKVDNAAQPVDGRQAHFDIDAPRFTLAANEIGGYFPPKNGHGPFDEAIPHVALGRRTLPWERLFSAATSVVNGMPIPWMALLMFEDGESTIETKQKIGDKLPADVVARLAVPGDQLVDTVTAPLTLVKDLMPSYEELALLTHVREVNVDDRELAAGDSDGFFAVVMGNRIPRRGAKYRCCLVSVEERTDLVPPKPPPVVTVGVDSHVVLGDQVFVANANEVIPPVRVAGELSFASQKGVVGGGAIGRDLVGRAVVERDVEGAIDKSRQASLTAQLAKDKFRIKPSSVVLQSASLVLLTTWTFECDGTASFRALMQSLDVGMIGKPSKGERGGPTLTDSGHLRIDSLNRAGAPETVFYRGPLVPAPLSRDPNGPYHSADQARRVAPDVGAEDVSYACAFEVGRLIAAADARLAQELMRWRRGGYKHAVRHDHLVRIQNVLKFAQAIDERLPLAAFIGLAAVTRINRGCPPLADAYDLAKLRSVAGFDTAQLQQTFALQSVEQAKALLGGGAALLDSAVSPPVLELLAIETLDAVMRDAVGLSTLQDMRATVLDNVRTQLRDFGRLTR